ncbi:hypothetical protein AAZX31_11G207100 [Glycine max]
MIVSQYRSEIVRGGYDTDYLLDVMGLLNWCWIREGAGNKRQKNLNECDIYRS